MTNQTLQDCIDYLYQTRQVATLEKLRRGIEKESLRVAPNGALAQTGHPLSLGSALTHPHITTDYSEALLEFITPAYEDLTDCLLFLADVHHFTYKQLQDEMLWTNSMPCLLPKNETEIPIAQYGRSNIGLMKTIYRKGLWHRYGRPMQTIAGIHYNLSLPENFWYALADFHAVDVQQGVSIQDYISSQYFQLIRNFHKLSWLPIYLFGATPTVCKSFLSNQEINHQLQSYDDKTYFLPYATSLRLSDIGYQNDAQSNLNISYDSVIKYVQTLEQAMCKPYPPFEAIGLKKEGHYQQLSTNALQIENEYYGMIRPKRVTLSGERPSNALRKRGVEYVELRLLDIDPFMPLGIEPATGYFLELLSLYCLLGSNKTVLQSSPEENNRNKDISVKQGRDPRATIIMGQQEKTLQQWGLIILEEMQPLAELLDKARVSQAYSETLAIQKAKLLDADKTPSGKVMQALDQQKISFGEFALSQARQHQNFFAEVNLSKNRELFFNRLAKKSIEEQKIMDAQQQIPFEEFLTNWFR